MVNNWFECKVKYVKVDDKGKEVKITEPYLIDALSFTEAEARMNGKMEYISDGEFVVTAISRSNITEVFPNENGDRWFKAKTKYTSVNEDSGKESDTIVYMLIEANNIKHAYECIEKELKNSLIPFETPSISESPILDVFPYFDAKNGMDIPSNLEPIEKKSVQHLDCEPKLATPDYDPNKSYIVGESVMIGYDRYIITSNGTNATYRLDK